jgi:uncharacterized membrane protein YoaK (UPF0700 family)
MIFYRLTDNKLSRHLPMAALLSLVAGVVNITSLLFANTLVSNITGHFSFFSEQASLHHYARAGMYLIYILCFLGGAFICSLLLQKMASYKPRLRLILPIFLELLLLLVIIEHRLLFPISEHYLALTFPCILLFAMGVQNALVTIVSSSLIRTTHLTGLFTDLGIEISQWVLDTDQSTRKPLQSKMFLKTVIIAGFFIGGLSGGLSYSFLHIKTLYIAVAVLVLTLLYEEVKLILQYREEKTAV